MKCDKCGHALKVQHGMNHVWPGQVVPLMEAGFLTYCPDGCDIASPYEIKEGRVVCIHDVEPVTFGAMNS